MTLVDFYNFLLWDDVHCILKQTYDNYHHLAFMPPILYKCSIVLLYHVFYNWIFLNTVIFFKYSCSITHKRTHASTPAHSPTHPHEPKVSFCYSNRLVRSIYTGNFATYVNHIWIIWCVSYEIIKIALFVNHVT